MNTESFICYMLVVFGLMISLWDALKRAHKAESELSKMRIEEYERGRRDKALAELRADIAATDFGATTK